MKRVSLILSAVMLTAMMLSSCGSDASSEEGASAEATIGTQVWMTKNLDVVTFRNGDPIPEARTAEEWERAGENKQPAWCYYENDPANGAKYGKLYNCYAVIDSRGLAPVGYHIPSDVEWTKLEDFLGSDAGKKMKSKGGWIGDDYGTNESGFTGLPGGMRLDSEGFTEVGFGGYWWSSSEDLTSNAWGNYEKHFFCRNLNAATDGLHKRSEGDDRGLSVRCLRD